METRSSPDMHQLRALAAERGLKYYKHLSKPELFALLRREGGVPPSLERLMDKSSEIEVESETKMEKETKTTAHADEEDCGHHHEKEMPTRTSARLHTAKRKAREDEEATARKTKKAKTQTTTKAKTVVNTLDPIMLTELGPHTVEFVRSNGAVVVYNVDTLVQYMLATGHFAEPETRVPFSDDELRRIDYEVRCAKLDLRSVLEAKRNVGEFDEAKVKRDGLLGMERCAGEHVAQMLGIVESEDTEEGEIQLIVSVFPSFSSIFAQLRKSDKEYAKQCMSHFKAYLRGPKNRPIVDRSGLLPVILSFLDDVASGRQDATSFGF